MWEILLRRPSFILLLVVYAVSALAYLVWLQVRDVYTVTTKHEVAQLVERISTLRSRVDQSKAPLKDADTLLAATIDKKGQDLILNKDEDARKATLQEINQLSGLKATIGSQIQLTDEVLKELRYQEEFLARMSGQPPLQGQRSPRLGDSLRSLQIAVENAAGSAIIRPSFADTPQLDKATPGNGPTVGGGDAIPSWVRVAAQLLVTAIVSVFLGFLGIKSTAYMFAAPPEGDANDPAVQAHNQGRLFAQEMVKTLVTFSFGIVTGLVAIR
jgi:hypothetical protein